MGWNLIPCWGIGGRAFPQTLTGIYPCPYWVGISFTGLLDSMRFQPCCFSFMPIIWKPQVFESFRERDLDPPVSPPTFLPTPPVHPCPITLTQSYDSSLIYYFLCSGTVWMGRNGTSHLGLPGGKPYPLPWAEW